MRIGFVGLGKLGLPVATCMDMKGHDVMGYDIDPSRMSKAPQPYQETGPSGTGDFNDWLAKSNLKFDSLEKVVRHGEIIFVAVQTPHESLYEGVTPLPKTRKDFDYSWLEGAMRNINFSLGIPEGEKKIVVVISTCLPGTMGRLKKDWKNIRLVYNPFFIAMGTTMRDFLNPEFILIGDDGEEGGDEFEGAYVAASKLIAFYSTITEDTVACVMSIASAELTKVAYNTYISSKIAFANTVMEICDHPSMAKADCDDVVDALSKATTRLISPAYLRGGMGDGGGCHPRDNIAMSWLAKELDLSHNLFDDIMKCRQDQSLYLVELVKRYAGVKGKKECFGRKVVILGSAFKPETNLTIGSPARLLQAQLESLGFYVYMEDPVVTPGVKPCGQEAIYVIGCKHQEFKDYVFPKGSIVIDPHRYIPDQEGVIIHRIGEAR